MPLNFGKHIPVTPSLKSLLWAGRFMALLGLLALSFTEEITGVWLQISWLALAASLALDHYPALERLLRRWETLGVIGLVGLTLLDFVVLKNSLFVVVAHFLLILQTLKLVGLKERKDCFQIGLIGFFQLLAACTLSADVWQAILLLLLIPGITALLFWNYAARIQEEAEVKTQWPDRSLQKLHKGLSAAALPLNIALTVVVFVLFPRLTFNVRVAGFGAGRSAYTDQMNLEQTGFVTQDRSIAAWMGFRDDEQRSHWTHYLRGDILGTFNGKEWINTHEDRIDSLTPDGNGVFKFAPAPPGITPLHATITLLNTTKNTLFTPGTPLEIIAALPHIETTDAGDLHWASTFQHPLQYEVIALPDERQDSTADDPAVPARYAQLPSLEGLERTQTLSQRIAGTGSALEKARALEAYLRDHYQYTLNFGSTVPENPVDYFLFESRQGFCIHFAAALAVMLRLENIPSRVVAGYYQGEWNPLAHQILFREQDAHAWVEAWVDGHWITLDPSPRASSEAASANHARFLWLRLREIWDYLGYKWDRLIIEYDIYSQLRAWEHLRSHSDQLSARWLARWTQWRQHRHSSTDASSIENTGAKSDRGINASTLALGVLSGGILLIVGIARKIKQKKSDIPIFYTRFLRQMARLGFSKNPAETAAEFANRLTQRLPQQAPHIQETTNAYYRLRFGKK